MQRRLVIFSSLTKNIPFEYIQMYINISVQLYHHPICLWPHAPHILNSKWCALGLSHSFHLSLWHRYAPINIPYHQSLSADKYIILAILFVSVQNHIQIEHIHLVTGANILFKTHWKSTIFKLSRFMYFWILGFT